MLTPRNASVPPLEAAKEKDRPHGCPLLSCTLLDEARNCWICREKGLRRLRSTVLLIARCLAADL